MTIAAIIARAKGKAGHWEVSREYVFPVGEVATLWHYSHPMARWAVADPTDARVLDIDVGWGSVSDQQGVNTLCRVLGLPFRMDRDAKGGGPRISPLALRARVGDPVPAGDGPYPTLDDTRHLCQHPDPWMDSEPGTLTFPQSWTY